MYSRLLAHYFVHRRCSAHRELSPLIFSEKDFITEWRLAHFCLLIRKTPIWYTPDMSLPKTIKAMLHFCSDTNLKTFMNCQHHYKALYYQVFTDLCFCGNQSHLQGHATTQDALLSPS